MPGYLIKDTTEKERREIVERCLEDAEYGCGGSAAGGIRMYEAYIKGEKELSEINREYEVHYVCEEPRPEIFSCWDPD